MTSVYLVDDHNLLRSGMAGLVSQFQGYIVLGQAANGQEFIEALKRGASPHIVILDVQMPIMNGEQTAQWLRLHRSDIKILVLTMHDDEMNIMRMIRAGASGYILKDTDPAQLKVALDSIRDKGAYYADFVADTLRKVITHESSTPIFTDRELEFIRLACTDLTYKEIAVQMNCATRTVDNYRDDVFDKMQVKSRMGLALFAFKNGLVKV